jgi:hypothetical protein
LLDAARSHFAIASLLLDPLACCATCPSESIFFLFGDLCRSRELPSFVALIALLAAQ